jgi:tetratricopeptide (TPR) repeat protein
MARPFGAPLFGYMNLIRHSPTPLAASCLLVLICLGLKPLALAQKDAGFDPQLIFRIMEQKDLTETHLKEGRPDEAVKSGEQVLASLQEVYGPDHLDVADWRGTLGNLYLTLDAPDKALPQFEKMGAYFEAHDLKNDLGYTESLSSIARCLLELADYENAAEIQKQCLASIESSTTSNSEFLALHTSRLGMIYWQMGDRSAALPYYTKSLEQYRTIHGDDHSQTAISLNNLGTLYMELSEYDKALPLLDKALPIAEATLGFDHPNTIHVLNNLGELYEKRKEYDLALTMVQRSLIATEKHFGLDSIETAAILNHVGRVQSELEHPDQATALFGRSYDILQEKLAADRADDPEILGLLGACYHGLGQANDAETYYKRSLQAYEEQRGEQHPYTRQARESLVEFYDYLGRFDDANAIR